MVSINALSRRSFLRMAGSTAAVVLVAACAPQVEVDVVDEPEDAVVTEPVAAEPEPPRDVALTFLSQQATIGEQEPINILFSRFEDENPGVTVQRLTTAAGDDYFTKLVTMTAAGTPPDLFYMPPWNLVYFKDEGLLAPLDPFIDVDQSLDRDNVVPGLLNEYSWNEELLGLPVFASILRIWAYNKDAFDEAGVEYPTRNWSYDEFLEKASMAMTRVGDEVDVWGGDPRLQDNAHLLPWLWTFGGDFYNYPELTASALTRPESIEAMQASVDLLRTYEIQPPPEIGPMDLGISFPAGKLATSAIGTGQWIDPTDREVSAWPFSFGLIEQPTVRETHSLIHSTGISMAAQPSDRDAAWRLLAHLMSEESQIFYSESAGGISGLLSVGAQYAFADLPAEDLAVINDNMDRARSRVYWRTPVWGRNATDAQAIWQSLWLGDISAEEACTQAAQEIDAVLEEALAEQ